MKNKIVNFLFVLFFVLVLAAGTFLSVLEEDKNFSVLENRNLTKFEGPTDENFLDGKWFAFFETYCKDQFLNRDSFIQLYNYFLDFLGVKERNGYVVGEDSFILPVRTYRAMDSLIQEANDYGSLQVKALLAMSKAADAYGGKVIYMNIPHKNELYIDKYPEFYIDQKEFWELKRNSIIKKAKENGINVVETYDLLNSHKDEYIYYATDHHWTVRGAYYAYQELLKYINDMENGCFLEYPEFEKLNIIVNSERMIGSYLRKLGDSGIVDVDYMEYALPYDMPEYTRYDNGELSTKQLCNISDPSYQSFMEGDISNTVIETDRKDLPNVLYIGLSYSNPLEMMSVYNFNRVESIDPRYWNGSVCQYISESKPDYIVIIRDDIYDGKAGFSCTVE